MPMFQGAEIRRFVGEHIDRVFYKVDWDCNFLFAFMSKHEMVGKVFAEYSCFFRVGFHFAKKIES